MGFAAAAFPPVDVADGGEERRRVVDAAVRVGVEQYLLGPFDAGPLRLAGGLGQEDLFHEAVDAR